MPEDRLRRPRFTPGRRSGLVRLRDAARRLLPAVLIAGLLMSGPLRPASGQDEPATQPADDQEPQNPFPNRFPLPSGILDGGKEWLNASGEITLRDLKGKVVLFDFWTYCCINCMHVLPDLAYLEAKYPNELVVVGVHSAKFDTEKDSENIRRAIMRYEIEHPVVNDAEMQIWQAMGVRAWPTLVLVDPEGQYCGYISGEGHREVLDKVVASLVAFHRAKGTLDESPVSFTLERDNVEATPLRFPGKVLADGPGNRLFISDSNHNRIVICTLEGDLLDVVGNGAIGAADGSFEEATFDHPQGMALVGNTLYVADTENHLIREVDLNEGRVSTLAGTGHQARVRAVRGLLKEIALNSPWALAHLDGTLYIAMAGPHQIWSHKLGSETIGVFSGTGREDIRNGTHTDAAYAQPSGLATDGEYLYVADSEGSAIRKVPLASDGTVTTIVGTHDLPQGRSLFEFGDRDGTGDGARLQHPLGVAYQDGLLYVADAYNHKIKKVTLGDDGGLATSWLGDGTRGDSVSPLRLAEPEGLSIAGDKLYIADTNNHRIVVADLQSGEASELAVRGLRPPAPREVGPAQADAVADVIEVESQSVKATDALKFEITPKLPEDYKLNPLAPVKYELLAEGPQNLVAQDHLDVRRSAETRDGKIHVSVPVNGKTGRAKLRLSVTLGYCREGTGGLCKLATFHWRIPVEATPQATQQKVALQAAAE